MIVAQFRIAVFLLIATLSVCAQLAHMKTRDLSLNKEQVLHPNLSGAVKQCFPASRQSLLAHTDVRNVALVGSVPGHVGTNRGYVWPDMAKPKIRSFCTMLVDEESVPILGLQIVQDRNFSRELFIDDRHAFILNETAGRELGWEDPLSRPFRVWDEKMGQVIQVVKDFHFKSPHKKNRAASDGYRARLVVERGDSAGPAANRGGATVPRRTVAGLRGRFAFGLSFSRRGL